MATCTGRAGGKSRKTAWLAGSPAAVLEATIASNSSVGTCRLIAFYRTCGRLESARLRAAVFRSEKQQQSRGSTTRTRLETPTGRFLTMLPPARLIPNDE